ncbi:MAG: hypothetical protein IJ327_03205 [Lachnospiraceae bacterium]|nr:hypothetical protein [Lachnospiraceae bacterium]
MQENQLRICKKCLTRDMIGQEEYFNNLRDYIENLDGDIKVDQEQYESRLLICKDCENLFQGMCRHCGCYVELRAVIRTNACPVNHWGAVQ